MINIYILDSFKARFLVMNLDKEKDPSQKDIKFILDLLNSSKLDDAKKEIEKKVKEYPNSSILLNISGAILAAQNKLDKAIENYKKAIKINPNYSQAYNNLGTALHKTNKLSEAMDVYNHAINLKKNFPEAYNNIGNLKCEIGKPSDSLSYFKKAIKIKPDYFEAYNNLGSANASIGDRDEAVKNFKIAIKIKPTYADAYNNLALEYVNLENFEEAMHNYKTCIKLKPDYQMAYNNLGNLLSDLGRFDEAHNLYVGAIKIKPDYAKAYSNLLFNYNYKINYDSNIYLSYAKKYRLNCKSIKNKLSFKYQYKKNPKKLRLGLISADFGNHPGGFFTLSTLKELRKKNFELFAYSTIDRKDSYVHHFKPLFNKWSSIKKIDDNEVIDKICKDGVHILLDLQGHSAQNRLPIFMYKPAPIQVSWLSQGSTGINEIDYLVAGHHTIQKGEENQFVEKIIKHPEISQCFTPPDFNIKIGILPAIKNGFITFGCLNKLNKINDNVVNLWSKILLSVPNSKIFLKTRELDNKKILLKTLERFKKNNIENNRLILEGKSKTRQEVLQAYNKIDIGLDPFPFQGNTSTCEAIWMGVPVLTLKGNRYLFHFGESINSNLSMFDWVAKDLNDYVSKAISFTSDIHKLSEIRINLRKKMLQSPVCDAPRFSEHFSKMLWKMWKKYREK